MLWERERGDNIMSDADKVAITNGWLLPRSPHKKILPFSSSSSSSYEQHYIHNHSWVAERIPWSDGRLLPRNRSFLASARSSQTLPQWRCRSHHQISPSAHRGSEFHVPCGRPRPKDQCVSFPVLLSVRLTPLICQGTIRCKTEEQGANRGRMSRRDVVKLAGTALGVVRSVSFLSSSRDGLLDSPLSLASGNPLLTSLGLQSAVEMPCHIPPNATLPFDYWQYYTEKETGLLSGVIELLLFTDSDLSPWKYNIWIFFFG